MQSVILTLAGKEYEIGEFTLAQLEDIQDVIMGSTLNGFRKNRDILVIALSVDHPEMNAELLGKMKLGSIRKVDEEVTKVLKFAGFSLQSEDKNKGEERASVA